jgi:hypothetical protein
MVLDDELINDEIWLNDICITLFEDDGPDRTIQDFAANESTRMSAYSTAALAAGKTRIAKGDLGFLHHYLVDKDVLLFYKVKLLHEYIERAECNYSLSKALTIGECGRALQEIRKCTSPVIPHDCDRLARIAEEASTFTLSPLPPEARYQFFHEFCTNMYPNLGLESRIEKARKTVPMEREDE